MDVTFKIDESSILHINAKAVGLDGVEKNLTISAETMNLSAERIIKLT